MKRKSFAAFFLILLLTAVTLLVSCISSQEPVDDGEVVELINYRFADKDEGVKLMLSNEAYYDGMTQNDLDFRMQKSGASMEEYKAFAKEQVIDFTDKQKAIIDEHMKRISKVIAERGYQIPELEQIVFINTTMLEEYGAAAYTHGTQIYISGDFLEQYNRGNKGKQFLDHVFAHELFHCLTRCNSDFRTEMYKAIHFTTREEDYELPPSVKEYFISNPDVERHNSSAAFVIKGKPIECFAAFVTTRHFKKKGDSFFDTGTIALVPVDGTDTYYLPKDAENFAEIFGKNTDYVIDPEECMADNFGFLIAYGMKGPDGKGYPNPEIVTVVEDALKK